MQLRITVFEQIIFFFIFHPCNPRTISPIVWQNILTCSFNEQVMNLQLIQTWYQEKSGLVGLVLLPRFGPLIWQWSLKTTDRGLTDEGKDLNSSLPLVHYILLFLCTNWYIFVNFYFNGLNSLLNFPDQGFSHLVFLMCLCVIYVDFLRGPRLAHLESSPVSVFPKHVIKTKKLD